MIAASFIIAIAVLTYFFSDLEQRRHNPNYAPASRITNEGIEVELMRNRQHHYVARGTINGESVEFLLDTGATDVVIPENLAARLGLAKGRPGRAMTANGAVTVFETWIDSLTIGDIELNNVRASINPAMNTPSILLGMTALSRVEFVQRGDSLTLRQITD